MKSISRYDIREPIGRGAMGQVYKAYDPVIERLVAIKTMDRSALAPSELVETVARFKREAIAAGRLTHPNIITVYEYGETPAMCFIAMEHAPGQTLHQFLTTTPLPTLELVQAIARQLFAAMVYAHEQGVTHRDLKPGNVMLMGNPHERASMQIKILDFGIARINTAVALTQMGAILGTPGYMSPEQYMGETVDARTDIYALGVILFQMLAGRRPFRGNMGEMLQQMLKGDPPSLSAARADLPPALDGVIAKALARNASARFAAMRDFREAFVTALARQDHNTFAVIFHPQEVPIAAGTNAPARPSEVATVATSPTLTESVKQVANLGSTSSRIQPLPKASLQPTPSPSNSVLALPILAGKTNLPLGTPAAARLSSVAQSIGRLASQHEGPSTKPCILFLDDEERILGALSALFRLKYDVLVCTEGVQALELVKTRQPNVIVSDQRMPNMLGIDFLRQAREIDPSSVRILLTGYSDLAAIVGSINDGEVFRFVNKPWSNQEIKNTIAEAVDISLSTKLAALDTPATVIATEAHRASEAVLVAQNTRELFELVNDGFGRTHPVCHASDVAAVLQTIEDQEVAVLICDLDAFDGASVMLKMLKQSHPQIQTLVTTGSSDSEALIGLINQAQIFRFLNRPMRLGLLDRALRGALGIYANVKARPVLAKRQQVEAKAEVVQSSIGHMILQRLSLLLKPRTA
jgi:eukaryotic-like serine/threonine-protein kinase